MGIGDEVMASGHARKVNGNTGRRVAICDRHRRPRWSHLWRGLPWIVHPKDRMDGVVVIQNGAQCRPYICYPFTRQTGIRYTGWKASENRGFMHFVTDEVEYAAKLAQRHDPFVIIEPNVPHSSNPNKQWGFSKWDELGRILKEAGLNPVQIGPGNTPRLENIPLIQTPTFHHGVAVMKFSRWNFLPDGGLHHAAGALGLPATVLWGGANDPEYLGYPEHHNVFFPTNCGVWLPCKHCATIWRWLKPADVFEGAKKAMREWKWQRSSNL